MLSAPITLEQPDQSLMGGYDPEGRFEQFVSKNEGRMVAAQILSKAVAPVQQSAQRLQPVQTLSQENPRIPDPALRNK